MTCRTQSDRIPVAASTDDRELYTPFATAESTLVDAALLLQADHSGLSDQPTRALGNQRLRHTLGVLVASAESGSAPRAAWRALARAANLVDWHEGHQVAGDLHDRIQGGLSRTVESDHPVFSVWGYNERTEAGRHCYVYHHALDYLLDRSAPVPFRLASAMAESLHAWEADMLEMHPDVLTVHEVTPSWSPAPVVDDVMSNDAPPHEAEFDREDLWVLDDVSRWTTMSAARERLLTFRMAINHLHANKAPIPKDVLRRLLASAAAVGSRRPDL
jgi:hypothetical protein